MSDRAWTDQKSASSNPETGSPKNFAVRKKCSSRPVWLRISLKTSSSRVPGIGVPMTVPMAKTRYSRQRKEDCAWSGFA
jgi:hypothetical protein